MTEANHLTVDYSFTQQALGVPPNYVFLVPTCNFMTFKAMLVFHVIINYSPSGIQGGMMVRSITVASGPGLKCECRHSMCGYSGF